MVKELIIWRGSQYSTKVIAALHTKGYTPEADYRLRSAPNGLEERKKLLPAPYTVPVLRWDDEIISGSDNICRFLDKQLQSAPPLYPAASDAEVRRLEEAAAALYWTNGWLSTVDPVGMEEWSGQRARNAVAKGEVGKLAKFAQAVLPQKTFGRVMHGVVQKDFRAFLRRRGEETGSEAPARLADERDSAKVLEEARTLLRVLDDALVASPTPYCCGSATPTAADLTLYGMLERWLGDSLCPGMNGASTPTIANGMAGVTAAWEAMRKTFRPDIDLHDLKDYKDLEEPITGGVTFPPSE